MARIRSIHPGQWTDAKFVRCSPLARLLALALRNEADDQGVFVWEPVDLKIRLLPLDAVDVEALLSELQANQQVCMYEVAGRQYGAIRNFARYQTPRFPKSLHPITDDIRKYVASTEPITEIAGDEDGTLPRNAEKVSLMERRGEERKKEPNGSSGVAPSARQPAARLAKDWVPGDADRDYAAQLGLSAADIEREAVKFRGYWTTGKGAGKRCTPKGWHQAWQNWTGKAVDRLPASPRTGGAEPVLGSPEFYAQRPDLKPSW